MLFIGGTHDGERINIPYWHQGPIFRILAKIDENKDKYNGNYIYGTEIYLKQEVWKKGRYIFSVMVKKESDYFLKKFLDKYNARNKA